MRRTKPVRLALCVVAAASAAATAVQLHSASAQGKPEEAQILGLGLMPCEDFIGYSKDRNVAMVTASLQWALGYISAMDHIGVVAGQPALFRGIDPDTIGKTLASFCLERPNDTLVKASNHMVNAMHKLRTGN